jgi:hypothetical protein
MCSNPRFEPTAASVPLAAPSSLRSSAAAQAQRWALQQALRSEKWRATSDQRGCYVDKLRRMRGGGNAVLRVLP